MLAYLSKLRYAILKALAAPATPAAGTVVVYARADGVVCYKKDDGVEMVVATAADIVALIDAAPGALDTLNELAAALGDDSNFAATMTTALAAKASITQVQSGSTRFAVAGGTADAITATLSPVPTLTDGMQINIRASGANTVTNPTLDLNGTGAKDITLNSGGALAVGDIPGAGYHMALEYRASSTRWELLNPAVVGAVAPTNAQVISAIATDPGAVRTALKLDIGDVFETRYDAASVPGSNVSATGWVASNLSGGTTALTAPLNGNSVGYLAMTISSSSLSKSALVGTQPSMYFGNGKAYWRSRQQLGSLSDATDDFTLRIGFHQQSASSTSNGAYFRYNYAVNGGKWEAVTTDNGTETATDTGVTAVAGVDRIFEVMVNAAGTSAEFKIDGAVVATNTTNIPTASNRGFGYGFAVNRAAFAGSGNKVGLNVDYGLVRVEFTTAR